MELISGYGIPYDPRNALEQLLNGSESALEELWENLYHQGDIGSASYFSVPQLVEAGQLNLVGAIEVARQRSSSPEVPESLVHAYEAALSKALESVPSEPEQLQGYYVIHASVHGQRDLARALDLMSVEEILEQYA